MDRKWESAPRINFIQQPKQISIIISTEPAKNLSHRMETYFLTL